MKKYYESLCYLQDTEIVQQLDTFRKKGHHKRDMITLASHYDSGDEVDQDRVSSSTSGQGNQVVAENSFYAVVYNAFVGGAYELFRKVSEADVLSSIRHLGLSTYATEEVRLLAEAYGLA